MDSLFTSAVATAGDGAPIAYRSTGSGDDLVIVHGAMQDATSQRDLAALLAGRFRVHLMDRRGRGASGPRSGPDGTAREVGDLRAVLEATGARRVVGVSSGAIIAARAALEGAPLERLVLFEPPLSLDGSMRLDRLPRFDAAVARGDLPTTSALGMKLAEMGPAWMFGLPLPVLALASRAMLKDPRRRALAQALPADVTVVRENAGHVIDFAGISVPTLVVDGTATRPYLRAAAAAVADTVPGAVRVSLEGQWHSATQNRDEYGQPDVVAPPLLSFLA